MTNDKLNQTLKKLAKRNNWVNFKVVRLQGGQVDFEVERLGTYDEIRFENNKRFSDFVYGLDSAATSKSQKDL